MKDFDDLRVLAKSSLSAFATVMHHDWQPNWHHRTIARALERMASGVPGWDRLIISLPPRSGKSELISRMFPGWYMATHPYENVIVATYGAELADDLGRKAREYASTELFESIMGATVSKDTNAITKWELSNRAGFFATSVGGALTGRGANCLIIDDPVKNREDAESETSLEKTFAWFTSTAYSRLEKNGKVVVVMTRWSDMDLAGRLLATNSGWRELVFPAIAEVDDEFRKVGAPLWPDKYPLDRLHEIKRTVGRRDWASLYQQRPAPAEGNIFREEWFKYYKSPQDLFSSDKVVTGVYQSWDTAVSAKKTSARSACTTWAVVENKDFYLLDIFAEPLSFPELRQKALALHEKWHPHTIFIEEQQTGRPLIDELRRTLGDKMVPVRLRGDKEVRARAASVAFETGRVFLPDDAPWMDEYTTMLMAFPSGRFVDLVDATSQALIKLMKDLHPRRNGSRWGAEDGGLLRVLATPIRSLYNR